MFLCWVLPAETQRGAFLFPLFSCSDCFLLGSSPGFGARVSPPPPKKWFSPLFEGRVCGVAEYPATTIAYDFNRRGRGGLLVATPTKLSRMTGCIKGRLDVYLHQFCKCPFGPLVAALFVLLVLSGNVFVTRGKQSASRAKTHRTRDLSVVLETHQLYSRLISCTRKISTLPWELKCDYPSLGEPRVYPSCDPGPVCRKI